jgi:2-polyprenyl-6-methoxyphenol hydroxylase-like FAD-dependent oxidoreductase
VSRHDLTKVLFESLPAESQAKIITNMKVLDIQPHDNGVAVSCQDGSSYSGAMIIGADGAHSTVRGLMRDLAIKDFSPEINEEQPFSTSYRCLWVRFPTAASPDLHPGFTSETHGRGASTQVFVGEGTGVIGVYERLDKPTKERIRYTQADQDALIDRLGHLPLTEDGKFTLRAAFERRVQSGLVSLEEGVVKHWSWGGRVVLAGDAAHKFTPSTGAGCNNGIIDVVALVNELRRVFQDARASFASGDASPSKSDVNVAMKRYQEARHAAVTAGCKAAGNATALSTWSNGMFKFVDCHVLGQRVQKRLSDSGSSDVAKMPVFTFVNAKEHITGKTPWTQPLPCPTMKVM